MERRMTPEISEFSYGFSLTNEIVGWASLKVAPIFPSLIEEGKAGGGYDVKLDMPGVPLYLQFKRADCMTRRSAHEISRHNLPLAVPFYRFPITQSGKSDQHALLLELDDGKAEVFYAAPRFYKLEHINEAWSTGAVAGRSVFVRPREIGTLDSDSHHVAYDDHRAWLCSKPRQLEFLSAARLVARITDELARDKRPLQQRLPELNAGLNEAWERGKMRVHPQGVPLLYAGTVRRVIEGQDGAPLLPGDERVFTRAPAQLSGDREQLRRLADNALKLFDAQLVIVQAVPST
jgi:hypothetical protein